MHSPKSTNELLVPFPPFFLKTPFFRFRDKAGWREVVTGGILIRIRRVFPSQGRTKEKPRRKGFQFAVAVAVVVVYVVVNGSFSWRRGSDSYRKRCVSNVGSELWRIRNFIGWYLSFRRCLGTFARMRSDINNDIVIKFVWGGWARWKLFLQGLV